MKHEVNQPEFRPNWFVSKSYGYGWYPVAWQGWLTILLFVVFLILESIIFTKAFSVDKNLVYLWLHFIQIVIAVTFLLIISRLSGPKLRWRWGK